MQAIAHNKYRQYAPAGPDVKTAARFVRRCGRRVWTPPLLQALCSITSRYDCLRVSGLIDDAVLVDIGP